MRIRPLAHMLADALEAPNAGARQRGLQRLGDVSLFIAGFFARSFAIHIQRNDIPVVVDFWAEWCGPCRVMAPVFERAAAEFEPELRFLKVDTEAEAELSARYNIRSIPTVMLFHKGNVIAQRAGAVTAEALRRWLRQHAPSAATAAS